VVKIYNVVGYCFRGPCCVHIQGEMHDGGKWMKMLEHGVERVDMHARQYCLFRYHHYHYFLIFYYHFFIF
jgi:hypothetical protein